MKDLRIHIAFRALYMGQNVYVNKFGIKNLEVTPFCLKESIVKSGSYLSLKPLSEISDEDAIELADMFNVPTMKKEWGNHWAARVIGEDDQSNIYPKPHSVIKITDFLRSKSYLMPFYGLSTEEILTRGWCKLQTK